MRETTGETHHETFPTRDSRCSRRNDDNSPTSLIDAYVGRLRAAGKQVQAYQPANGPHVFYFGRPDIPETKEAARLAVEFFRKWFRP